MQDLSLLPNIFIYSFIFLCQYKLVNFCFGNIPRGTQGLLLGLCSEHSWQAWKTRWDVKDQTQFNYCVRSTPYSLYYCQGPTTHGFLFCFMLYLISSNCSCFGHWERFPLAFLWYLFYLPLSFLNLM